MNGNLSKGLYSNSVEFMNDEDRNNVTSGNYPIIVAQNGVFTKKHISEAEFVKYDNWDAVIATRDEQWGIHGYAVPIVCECNEDGAMETGIPAGTPPENVNATI